MKVRSPAAWRTKSTRWHAGSRGVKPLRNTPKKNRGVPFWHDPNYDRQTRTIQPRKKEVK